MKGPTSENFHVHFVLKAATLQDTEPHVLFTQRSVGAASCSNSAAGQELDHVSTRPRSCGQLRHPRVLAHGQRHGFG